MKRVLVFSLTYYPTRVGGVEVALRELTERLAPHGIAFDIVTLRVDKKLPKVEKFGAATLYRVGPAADIRVLAEAPWQIRLAKVLYPFATVRLALRLHQQHSYDAVWAMMAAYAGFAALFFKTLRPSVPYLLTLQEGDPVDHILHRTRWVRPLFNRIFTKADSVQTISRYLAAWARQMGYAGPLAVVPNAVDAARFAEPASSEMLADARAAFGKKEGETLLITTSRLVHKNALDDVITALPLLPETVRFIVFGTGPEEKALRALAEQRGVAGRVDFRGQAEHAALPAYLQASDIFIRPSRSEGMGNSFVEAMAAGIPVIATQEGGIADFLFDAKRNPDVPATGWAVDKDSPAQIAEAVRTILGNPEETRRTVVRARALVFDKYDWDVVAQDMAVVFESLFAGANKGKNVLIATPLYPPESGGPATYAKLLEDELPKRGWAVSLVKFGDTKHLPKGLSHAAYAWRVYRAACRADAVYALDPVSTGLPAYIAARLARKPFYLKVVGDYAWEQGTQRFGVRELLDDFVRRRDYPFPVRMLRAVETCVAQGAARVITPSEYLKGIVAAWGVPPEKVRVVYNAPDVAHARSAYPRPSAPTGSYIVGIGRLVPWKGFDGVIRALALLAERGSGLSLVIVGGGAERRRLEAIARELGIADRVLFTGALPPAEALAYLAHAESLVLNTGYEGFSHLILEAFALGTPVLTTPVGGNPEQVENGVSGLFFPYQDAQAIAAAVEKAQDPALRARLAEGGTRFLSRFTKDRLVGGIIEALA